MPGLPKPRRHDQLIIVVSLQRIAGNTGLASRGSPQEPGGFLSSVAEEQLNRKKSESNRPPRLPHTCNGLRRNFHPLPIVPLSPQHPPLMTHAEPR
jgi:hypothetical protein